MRRKNEWKLNKMLPCIMLLISLAGFCFFYLIPFLLSFFYSVVDNPVNGKFCGLQNYKALFQNIYFLRGLKNTVWFMAVSIPLNVVLSLCVAFVVRKMKAYSNYFSLFFLIPLAIPSATSAFFWENFFGLHGTLNRFLSVFHEIGRAHV